MKTTNGQLELCGLEIRCIIGDRPEERVCEQTLVLNVVLTLDMSDVLARDALNDTVDYVAVACDIRMALSAAQFRMIESAAECAAQICLRHARVDAVCVRVEKLAAVPGLRAAAVTVERTKGTA
ncbi:MAG: dihydroneopterin aldolase [bacterium]